MKANELMIDDWVYNKNIDKPIQIYPTIFSQMFRSNPNAITEDYNIFPITLTTEILEKNGFVKFIAGQYLLPAGGNEWIVTIIPNLDSAPNSNGTMLIAIKNIYTDAKIAITYVHQLQHALKLCGIDKTIEL